MTEISIMYVVFNEFQHPTKIANIEFIESEIRIDEWYVCVFAVSKPK